jgi:spore maturation protein CgeB
MRGPHRSGGGGGAAMKLVIFGLSVSSSWGNGHAVLWRALIRSLGAQGHRVVFFERDVPYYAENRDLTELDGGTLVLYRDWNGISASAGRQLADADAAVVTSYCPDAIAASDLILDGSALKVFYDLDSPVTLARMISGERVAYLREDRLAGFDLVLSYAGGFALTALRDHLGAGCVAPLYGSVDPLHYRPVSPSADRRAALSYLGTYAEDRQQGLNRLFLGPARRRPGDRFVIGGALYPPNFPWLPNVFFERHVSPSEHPRFYAGARATLNVTRAAMASCGWCPSGRLFEAAACGAAILSDEWDGLVEFFVPGSEILIVSSTEDVLAALDLSDRELARIGAAARERALSDHSADRRAAELVRLLSAAHSRVAAVRHQQA